MYAKVFDLLLVLALAASAFGSQSSSPSATSTGSTTVQSATETGSGILSRTDTGTASKTPSFTSLRTKSDSITKSQTVSMTQTRSSSSTSSVQITLSPDVRLTLSSTVSGTGGPRTRTATTSTTATRSLSPSSLRTSSVSGSLTMSETTQSTTATLQHSASEAPSLSRQTETLSSGASQTLTLHRKGRSRTVLSFSTRSPSRGSLTEGNSLSMSHSPDSSMSESETHSSSRTLGETLSLTRSEGTATVSKDATSSSTASLPTASSHRSQSASKTVQGTDSWSINWTPTLSAGMGTDSVSDTPSATPSNETSDSLSYSSSSEFTASSSHSVSISAKASTSKTVSSTDSVSPLLTSSTTLSDTISPSESMSDGAASATQSASDTLTQTSTKSSVMTMTNSLVVLPSPTEQATFSLHTMSVSPTQAFSGTISGTGYVTASNSFSAQTSATNSSSLTATRAKQTISVHRATVTASPTMTVFISSSVSSTRCATGGTLTRTFSDTATKSVTAGRTQSISQEKTLTGTTRSFTGMMSDSASANNTVSNSSHATSTFTVTDIETPTLSLDFSPTFRIPSTRTVTGSTDTVTSTSSHTRFASETVSGSTTLTERTETQTVTSVMTLSQTVTERMTDSLSDTQTLFDFTRTSKVVFSTDVPTFTLSVVSTPTASFQASLDESRTESSHPMTNTTVPSPSETATSTFSRSATDMLSESVTVTVTSTEHRTANASISLTLLENRFTRFTLTVTETADRTLSATPGTETLTLTSGRTQTFFSHTLEASNTSNISASQTSSDGSGTATSTVLDTLTGDKRTASLSEGFTRSETRTEERRTGTVTVSFTRTITRSFSLTQQIQSHTESFSILSSASRSRTPSPSGSRSFTSQASMTSTHNLTTTPTQSYQESASSSESFSGSGSKEITMTETQSTTFDATRTLSQTDNSPTATQTWSVTDSWTVTPPPTLTFRLISSTREGSPTQTSSRSLTPTTEVTSTFTGTERTESHTHSEQITHTTTHSSSMTFTVSSFLTQTQTAVLSPTRGTLSQSITFSSTRTPTPSVTPSHSQEASPTATSTSTGSFSYTTTADISSTESANGATGTMTLTLSTSRTATRSSTSTITAPVPTGTVTETWTDGGSGTVSESTTLTFSRTNTISAVPSLSLTRNNSASRVRSISSSLVRTPSHSRTATLSDLSSASNTVVVSASHRISASPSKLRPTGDRSVTKSGTETRTVSSSSSSSNLRTKTESEGIATGTTSATVTGVLSVTQRFTPTQLPSSTKAHLSRSATQPLSMTRSSSVTDGSLTAVRTLSLTRLPSPSSTMSTNITLSVTRTATFESPSPSAARTSSESKTHTGVTPTASIRGYVSAVVSYVPQQPTVVQPITFSITSSPRYVLGDAAYLVPFPPVGSTCPDRIRSRNSSLLSYVSGLTSLPIIFRGSVRVVGTYQMCLYSFVRGDWSVVPLYLFASPYVVPNSIIPRVQATSGWVPLRLSVFGASLTDHVLVHPTSLSRPSQPCDPTAEHAVLFNSFVHVTNVSFASNQTLTTSGDFTVCYWGPPYEFYRLVQSRWRVEGRLDSIVPHSSLQLLTTYSPIVFEVLGAGLATRDPLLVANGSSCSLAAKLVAGRHYAHEILSPSSRFPTLSSVTHRLTFFVSSPLVSVCVRSNTSNYFSSLAKWAVPFVTASSVQPNFTIAAGAFVNFSFTAIAGTLDHAYDAAFLCNSTSCNCSRSASPLLFNQTSQLWEGRAPALFTVESTVASVCYATNTSVPWQLAPSGSFILRRYAHIPDVLPSVVSGSSIGMRLVSHDLDPINLRVFAVRASDVCGKLTPQLDSTVATVVLETLESVLSVKISPHRVMPMRLCFEDTRRQVFLSSQVITVLPASPTGFTPNEFFANITTDITFFPADGSTFSFIDPNLTVIACSPLTPLFVIEGVRNATTLSIRFFSITEDDVRENAFCMLFRNNSLTGGAPTVIPVMQISGVLRVNPFLVSAELLGDPVAQTSGSVLLMLTGYDLEPRFVSIRPCSTSPLLTAAAVSNSSQDAGNVTTWSTVVELASAGTGRYAVCFSYTRSPLVSHVLFVRQVPLTVTFDSLAAAAAQLPQIPHPVAINPLFHTFSLSVAESDRTGVFSSVKVARFVAASVAPCDELSATLFSQNASMGIWRYDVNRRFVRRGGVLLCYRSLSDRWYLFNTSDTFFNQAVPMPNSLFISTLNIGPPVYHSCQASLVISGFQLDGREDSFFATEESSCENVSTSQDNLAISSVQLDTTNLAFLVNISFSHVFSGFGWMRLCTVLGRASRAVEVGVFEVKNPLLITGITAKLACQSKAVLTSPVPVEYEMLMRLEGSSNYLPLAGRLFLPVFTLDALPSPAFSLRIIAFQPELSRTAELLRITQHFNATELPTKIARAVFCTGLTQQVRGAALSDFATAVVLMANYRNTSCGELLAEGKITVSPTTVLNAAVAQVNAVPSLLWDGVYFLALVSDLLLLDENPTNRFVTLLSLTDPFLLYTGNVNETLRGQLELLNSVSAHLEGRPDDALAALVMQRVWDVYTICCAYLPSGQSIRSVSSSSSMGITRAFGVTGAGVGGTASGFVQLPPPENITNPSCRGVATLPTILRSRSGSRRSGASPDPPFNLSTMVVLSDVPITTFALGYSLNQSSVDRLSGYRYYPVDETAFSSNKGGTWQKVSDMRFQFRRPSLFINVSSSRSTGTFAVFAGVATQIFPDPMEPLLRRANETMAHSGYYILFAILVIQIAGLFTSAWYDQWNNARRLKAAHEFVHGVPSTDPTMFQLHRITTYFIDLSISLTPSEQTNMLHNIGGSINGDDPVVALDGPSFHPSFSVSTVSKNAAFSMHLLCLALAACFTTRQDVASQMPDLAADWVGFGIVAAVFAWPFSVWTRVVLLRTQRDIPSLAGSAAAIAGVIIAGGASGMALLPMLATLLGCGCVLFTVVALYSRRWWSLLNFIHVNVVVRVTGSLLFLVAEVSAIIVLFFVPYFTTGLTIYTGKPYLGRDPTRAPDGNALWQTFLFALLVDLAVLEPLKAVALHKMHRLTNGLRWNFCPPAYAMHAPTDASRRQPRPLFQPPPTTRSLPPNIEEIYGDAGVKELDSPSSTSPLPPATHFKYDPHAGLLVEEVGTDSDDNVHSSDFEPVFPASMSPVSLADEDFPPQRSSVVSTAKEPFADIPFVQEPSPAAAARPNPLRDRDMWQLPPSTRPNMRMGPPEGRSSMSIRLQTPSAGRPDSPFDYLDVAPENHS